MLFAWASALSLKTHLKNSKKNICYFTCHRAYFLNYEIVFLFLGLNILFWYPSN